METEGTPGEESVDQDSASSLIARVWYDHGLFCATHPRLVIFLSTVVVLTCSAPLLRPGFGVPATEEGRTTTMFPRNDSTIPPWFVGKPLLYVLQFVLTVNLKPWTAGLTQNNEVMKEALKPSFFITKTITDYKDKQSGNSLSDVCLHVTSGPSIRQRSGLRLQDSQFLPAKGCLLLSPANLWNRSIERFDEDYQVIDDLYQEHGRPAINIALKEFIFGIPLKKTGLYPNMEGTDSEHTVRYAVTLLLDSHDPSYIAGLRRELRGRFPKSGLGPEKIKDDQVIHIYYKRESGSLVELGPISVAYFVVFLYLAFSVAKIDMVKSKWGLAFSAVITVMASLVMAAGLCSIFGIVPTLHSSEIFPYLVIMIGVENILVITKSVVSTPVDLDVKFRVAQGLSKEGKYMLKNLFTEMLVLGMGYLSFVPAIQEFCLFALTGLLTDFFLQVFLFATILSIDIRRMEISDLQRASVQQALIRQKSLSQTSQSQTASPAVNSPQQQSSPVRPTTPMQPVRILPPLPSASVTHRETSCPVMPKKSKRLVLAYFWARTRMVQKACMVCAIVYFLYMVFYSVPSTLSGTGTNQAGHENVPPNDESLIEMMIREALSRDDSTKEKSRDGTDRNSQGNYKDSWKKSDVGTSQSENGKTANTASWTSLPKKHWPQLLSFYNISLVGRYISVFPAVQLGLQIDTQIIASKLTQQGPQKHDSLTLPTKPLPQDLDSGSGYDSGVDTLDPEYYLSALYCVLLGMLAMIVLFFVCKYLNDLQITPGATRHRRRTGVDCAELVEVLPVSLRGHAQSIEHVKCTLSSIVSICLSGQIRVWDRSTGECQIVINRNGEDTSVARRRRHSRSSRKLKKGLSWDADFTTARYFQSLEKEGNHGSNWHTEPECSDSDGAQPNALQSSAEHGVPISTTDQGRDREKDLGGSLESSTSDPSGFDFSPYYQGGATSWSSRLSSSRSFGSSWSSDEEGANSLSDVGSDASYNNEGYRVKAGDVAGKGEIIHRRTAAVWCLDCRGDILATGCSDGSIELWSLSSGRQICLYCENRDGVTSVTFLPDSPQIVVARLDGTLDFLSLISPAVPHISSHDFSPVKRYSPRVTRKAHDHIMSPESACSGVSGSTALGAHALPAMCSLTHRVRAHHQPVSVLVATEGTVVTGSHDRTLKVFRTDECVRIFTLHGHRDGITALKVDESNSRLVISGASNGGVRVWDVKTGECLQHLRGHTCAVTAITCTQFHLISVSIDNSMCIWDRPTGKCIHYKLRQFPDLCSNVAMLSNNLFVTGGQGTIVLWDLLAGKQVKSVTLGNGDASVFVHNVFVCDTATVVCDYGRELRVVVFPAIMNKAE